MMQDLAERVLRGERRAIARAMTHIEEGAPGSDALMDALYPATGRAWRIGLTGPPGAGKSTLVGRLIQYFRAQDRRVGVIAVDPSSPFTGGALLGDRVRMGEYPRDDGLFIRSLATRGALGGLSVHAEGLADVLDAAGYEVILIETVGVGQAEVDVAHAADTVTVVLVPESGDAIQAMKAGLMEIAHLFAVNKADHAEADALVHAVRSVLHLRAHTPGAWTPEVVKTIATGAEGPAALVEALVRHRDHLQHGGWSRNRQDRLRRRVRTLVASIWHRHFWTPEREALLDAHVRAIDPEERRPYALAERLTRTEGA